MIANNWPWRRWLLVAVMTFGTACTQASKDDAVTLDEARDAVESGRAIVFDLREPPEHAQGVIKQAHLLPMSQLGRRHAEIPTNSGKPVYLICATQNRSRASLKALREQGGYTHVRYVVGGMSGWASRGWPMTQPVSK
jgi:rhodanese-related sulfurtransferase